MRLWAHEALRLFQDRLVEDSERLWTDENIDTVAMRFFPGMKFYNGTLFKPKGDTKLQWNTVDV